MLSGNSIEQVSQSMSFLLRRFDTLSLRECLKALEFASKVRFRKPFSKSSANLLTKLSDRLNFLLENHVDLSEDEKSRLFFCVSEHHPKPEDVGYAISVALRGMSPVFFRDHLKQFYRLRHIPDVGEHIQRFIQKVDASHYDLVDTCVLMDLILESKNSANFHELMKVLIGRVNDTFESNPSGRLSFYNALNSLLLNKNRYIWSESELESLIKKIAQKGLYPRKAHMTVLRYTSISP